MLYGSCADINKIFAVHEFYKIYKHKQNKDNQEE